MASFLPRAVSSKEFCLYSAHESLCYVSYYQSLTNVKKIKHYFQRLGRYIVVERSSSETLKRIGRSSREYFTVLENTHITNRMLAEKNSRQNVEGAT